MKNDIDKLLIQIAKEVKKDPEVVRRDIEEAIASLYDEEGHGKNEEVIKIFGNQKPDLETFIITMVLELERRMKS